MELIILTQAPLFISLEGVDGAGKTTQIILLKAYLEQQNIPHVMTREPGGTEQGRKLRTLLLEGDAHTWDGMSEALLFTADRHEHVRTLIRPALAKGKWVVTDRFADSTTVFQGSGRGINRDDLLRLHNLAVGDTWPDITLILDIDPKEGLKRKNSEKGLIEDRFESLGLNFQEKVRAGFHRIAKENPNRCHIINASGTAQKVHQRIINKIEFCQRLKEVS